MNKIARYRVLALALLGAVLFWDLPPVDAAAVVVPQSAPAPDETDLIYGVLASEPVGAAKT